MKRPADRLGAFFVGASPQSNTKSGGTPMAPTTNLTNEILQALVPASDERKQAALLVLRGEAAAGKAGPDTGPLLVGMSAAARLLGVSRSTLWRLLRDGRLPKTELFPGTYRIRRSDLDDLAAGRLTGGRRGDGGTASRRGRPRKAVCGCRGDGVLGSADPRFAELKVLADGGDECAGADLFKEFGYDHGAGQFVGHGATARPPSRAARGYGAAIRPAAESGGAA
jgi:excisionase family DNA binding protein